MQAYAHWMGLTDVTTGKDVIVNLDHVGCIYEEQGVYRGGALKETVTVLQAAEGARLIEVSESLETIVKYMQEVE